MSQLPYAPLEEKDSTPRSSTATINARESIQFIGCEHPDALCRMCKNKLLKKQPVEHTAIECLSLRCEILENEGTKLKDQNIKYRIQIKELEDKLTALEDGIKGLTAPKEEQAAPFNFNSSQKVRNPFKKTQSVDISGQVQDINYDNILPSRRSSSGRERLGLFGSLGASSQR